MTTAMNRIVITLAAVLLALPLFAHAESVVWNTGTPNLYTYLGAQGPNDWRTAIFNPNVAITYSAQIVNRDTGEVIGCGATIPSGTHIKYQFTQQTYTDINWFGTGYNFDSPYGDWVTVDAAPAGACVDKDLYDVVFTPHAAANSADCSNCYMYLYSPLEVLKPVRSVSGNPFTCSAPESDGSVSCTADKLGTAGTAFNIGATTGRFYFGASQKDGNGSLPGYNYDTSVCSYGPTPLASSPPTPYTLTVPQQTISCPITVISASGSAPTTPSVAVSGGNSCTVGTPYAITMSSTDPDNDQVKYGIDWNNNGTIDQFVPSSGYVASGIVQTASRTYATAGQKTIKVIAVDSRGLTSGWTTFTTSCADQADNNSNNSGGSGNNNSNNNNNSGNTSPSLLIRAAPSLVRPGDTTTVSWSASSVLGNTCIVTSPTDTLANGAGIWTGALSTGVPTSPITQQTIYTLSCTGLDDSILTQSTTVNTIPVFQEI